MQYLNESMSIAFKHIEAAGPFNILISQYFPYFFPVSNADFSCLCSDMKKNNCSNENYEMGYN